MVMCRMRLENIPGEKFLGSIPLDIFDVQSQQKDSAVGSPKADSDEGILMMKGSSQDDTLSQSPKGERLKFKCESEESSGILDDSDMESKGGAAAAMGP